MSFAATAVLPLQQLKMPTSEFQLAHFEHKTKQSVYQRDLLSYLGSLVDKRIADPRKDLISTLITEQV
jgi:hypothetical protein